MKKLNRWETTGRRLCGFFLWGWFSWTIFLGAEHVAVGRANPIVFFFGTLIALGAISLIAPIYFGNN